MTKRIPTFLGIALALVFSLGCGNGEKKSSETAESAVQEDQLYTCGMHPNVIQEGPGNCPICGMNLTPLAGTGPTVSTASGTIPAGERKILYWQAPMDPNYISPKPGKSPMGMDLIPVYEGEEPFGSTVKINPVVQQNIGVRTAIVGRKDLYQKIRTVGRVDYNEAEVAHVHTKFSGWIEKTHVNITGEQVRKGETLLEIYSPQLVSAQEEFLDAANKLKSFDDKVTGVARSNVEGILASARRRLEYFDISREQIEKLATTGLVRKTLVINSPFSGIVVQKHALDGMEVKSGMNLYTIANLSEIWVYADIYEYEVPWVKLSQMAVMTSPYAAGKKYKGKVQYIYPYLEEKTRTIKVRLSFPNPNLELKPGMYANVEIESSPVKGVVAVPQEAVLFSGERNLVFVALGEGRFAPRDVSVGLESGDGYYEIREGLAAGEEVVTSAQFLLDSESKLQESIAKMLAKRKGATTKPEVKMDAGKDSQHDMKMENQESEPDDGKHDQEHQMGGTAATAEVPFGKIVDGELAYYTCPMESHSFVRMGAPGSCPECGMKLVQIKTPFDASTKYYTCPMPEHSHVVSEEPGNCPLCGMDLTEIQI